MNLPPPGRTLPRPRPPLPAADLALPDAIHSEVRRYFEDTLRGVAPPGTDYGRVAEDTLSPRRAAEQLDLLCVLAGRSPSPGESFLEIGSGFGLVLAAAARRFGVDVAGIEVEERCLSLSRRVLAANALASARIVDAPGESLPHPPASFDWVYSSNVLEHVHNPERVLQEAARVLKPGGVMQFVAPNYGSFWEGHFGLPWIPGLCPAAARAWVRLFGRDPRYIDTLQLVSARRLSRAVARIPSLRLVDDGFALWTRRLRSGEFSEWALLGRLRRWVGWARALRLTAPLILLGRVLAWHSPVVLTAVKRSGNPASAA